MLPQNDRSNFRDTNLMERANRRKARAPRTETRLAAKQSGVLPLPDAQRCLSGGFQGINHKCGPVPSVYRTKCTEPFHALLEI